MKARGSGGGPGAQRTGRGAHQSTVVPLLVGRRPVASFTKK